MPKGIDIDRDAATLTLRLAEIARKVEPYFAGIGSHKPTTSTPFAERISVDIGPYRVDVDVRVNPDDPREMVAHGIRGWHGTTWAEMQAVVEVLQRIQPHATEDGIFAGDALCRELCEAARRLPPAYQHQFAAIVKQFKTQEKML